MLNRILVPLDGETLPRGLIPALRRVAGGTGAVVHMLAVRPEIRQPERCGDRVLYLDELRLQERAHWLDYLARQGSHLAYDGMVVQREVRFGDALAETLAVAVRQVMHLIVVTAAPQAWPARLLRPNLAQRLLAQAPIPVLALPAERPPWQGVVLRYDRVTA